MKKVIAFFLFAGILSTASAQKTINDPNVQKREASGYHAIEVSDGIDLYLSQGDESVAVSASETKFRDRIKTEVKNGVLKIFYERNNVINIEINVNRKMRAYVSFKDIDRLGGSGGSDISVEGSIKVNSLSLDLSGGSDFQGKVETNSLDVDASGGSDVHINGSAKDLKVEASGGSDFKGYELIADVCDLDASGGSDIYITVNKEMKVDASGGSDVYYKGNGSVTQMKSSGSSSIKKMSR